MSQYSLIIFVFFASLSQAFSETRVLGLRGDILGVQGQTIQSMALRSDGRYLFHHSTGSVDLKVLDLRDFARDETVASLSYPIVSLFLMNDRRLAVVTTRTVQYFDVSDPFDPLEETAEFLQSQSSTTIPSQACADSDGHIFILELGEGQSRDIVRHIHGVSSVASYSWTDLFAGISSLESVSLQCLSSSFFLLARKTSSRSVNGASSSYESELRVGRPGRSSVAIEFDSLNYARRDYLLSASKDQFLILFERTTSLSNPNDSLVRSFSTSSFVPSTVVGIGSGATALSSFVSGLSSFYGFFVGTDNLLGSAGASNVLLLTLQSALSNSSTFGIASDRGLGSADLGATLPTLTVSSKSDHYKILRSKSSGLSLMSEAARLSFASDPSGQSLGVSTPLVFSLNSDSDLNYQIRYNDNAENENPADGIVVNRGTLIAEGALIKDQNKDISISLSDLPITKKGNHSLVITGRENSTTSLDSRLGLRFSYAPPPEQIRDIQLGFGDQSLKVSFALPSGGNIKTLRFYFAQSETDSASIAEARSITLADGSSLSSPYDVTASGWKGSQIVAPLPNDQSIYVAVLAIDTLDQLGTISDVLTITPRRTITLAQAFGSSASCSLMTEALDRAGTKKSTCLFLIFFLSVLLVRILRKNWAQHI